MDPLFPERDPQNALKGEMFKADGMRRAEMGTPPTWRGWAELALRYVCEHREMFTSDPVWAVLEHWKAPPPPDPRALGPLMTAATGWGWCEFTGERRLSVHSANHRREVKVYRSHLFGGA
jgi:hypothetical protein